MSIITSFSYAATDNFNFSDFERTASTTISSPFNKAIGAILGVVRIVGTAVAFIIITVVAMKYMIAAPGDRAEMKKSSIQFVVGAVIVFGSSNLLVIIFEAINRVIN